MHTHNFMTVGYYRCPVCNARHSDSLLVHSMMRMVFAGPDEFKGWCLCPVHEQWHLEGYVALVEVSEDPEGEFVLEQLDNAQRTGNVFHILRERWSALFAYPEPPEEYPMVFVNNELTADLREASRKALH